MGDLCAGSGVVVEQADLVGRSASDGRWWANCPVCPMSWPVEPVEPAGLEPRWRLVDHQEAS